MTTSQEYTTNDAGSALAAAAALPVTASVGSVADTPHSGQGHRRRALPVTLSLLALAWSFLLVRGWPYYRLDMVARVRTEWHDALKPSGSIGLLYGYIGAACLFLLLTYSIHKRVRFLHRLWRLGRMLDFHILCGFGGPAFITLHAGFRFGGAIAVGYWAMLCVMVSGCIGFYLYRKIAYALSHNVGEQRVLHDEVALLDRELSERYHLRPAHLEELRHVAGADRAARMGAIRSLFFLVTQDLTLGLRLAWLRRRHPEFRSITGHEQRRLRHLLRQRVVLARRDAFLRQVRMLFGYWHAFHKPFAIVLYVTIALHIGVAVWLGYAWAW